MNVHHLGLYCIIFCRFLISKINIALQLTELWLTKAAAAAAAAATTTSTVLLVQYY